MGLEIAFYGKGGIGKSTVSSNVSYALSSLGKNVIQIGCDPKHDSTRSLLGGRHLQTVLDMVRTTKVSERRLENIMAAGSGGVRCIEAGGPEPGIGCAGKGILTMFQTLSMLGLEEVPHDCIVYDVLGDVVCGGFAVPMRPDYSDVVFIVSSGEFMSIYAANNIMKGMLRFGSDGPRLAGIVFNSRGSPKEDALITEFSRATGVPIIARIPRSALFEEAESAGMTVSEQFPDSEEAGLFRKLAEYIGNLDSGKRMLYEPSPLSDEQLEMLVSEGSVEGGGSYMVDPPAGDCPRPRYEKCAVFQPSKRIGMGPIAAAVTADKVTDIPVIIHGTKSCGYSMLNELYLERLARLDSNPDSEVGDGANMFCSDVDAVTSIFGGTANLEQLLESLAAGHRVILVIITCLTNMIGDDVDGVVARVAARHPGIRIGVINGNNALEGVDAHMEVLRFLTGFIDVTKTPSGDRVCILDDNHVAVNRGQNEKVLARLMKPFGKTVGRGFINDCTLEDIINLKMNDLVIPAENTADNMALAQLVRAKGVRVAMRCLPLGFRQGCEWMEHMGKMFSNKPAADYNLALMRREYESALSEYSGIVKGRRIAIIQDGSESTGWIEETLADAGIGEMTIYSMGRKIPETYIAQVRHHANHSETVEDILNDRPDLVIGSAYALRGLEDLPRLEYPHTTLAHMANIGLLKSLGNMFRAEGQESWKKWRMQ